MSDYKAPVTDMLFTMREVAGFDALAQMPGGEELSTDLAASILEEAARFSGEVLAPLNATGDRQGARVTNRQVLAADGFGDAFKQFAAAGWLGLPGPVQYGGQGLPQLLAMPVAEMWSAANLAFSLCPMLTQGAIDALQHHGSEELKRIYLPPLVAGRWTGTMNLTEPQAGTDLAAVTTKAVPAGDHYLLSGTKIYITWGDQDFTENIVHLVLARAPGGPPGTKGLSLFLVPKFLVNADGSLGRHNDVFPVSVEHKLGIHASPTCVMSYGENGGAVGYLVGTLHDGMACMFTMMNEARLAVGLEGVGIAERAYQQARDFAKQRVQGWSADGRERVTIIHHPDVRRMLLAMRSATEAMRSLAYLTAATVDTAQRSGDARARAAAQARVALLTPIVKGWTTELAQEIVSLGVQVHGGMGYIEETGAVQYLRDARILAIYEGTNGIQALDLVGRKILRDGGQALGALAADMQAILAAIGDRSDADLSVVRDGLALGLRALAEAGDWLREHFRDDAHVVGAIAYNFMMLTGTVVGGWVLAIAALAAHAGRNAPDADHAYLGAKIAAARFYAEHYLPRAVAYGRSVQAGTGALMTLSEAQF